MLKAYSLIFTLVQINKIGLRPYLVKLTINKVVVSNVEIVERANNKSCDES